ncbi:four-carbon acid sugar kinase family protein [Mariniflexile sp. HMF6888]|uniref:four-carbon acid sugar kinase family protein n=1 Tax=Mariniflexile sp. HMF6888 TaxID=3373086 RepID=UPI00379FC359
MKSKIIIVDDDPTGCQCVKNISILTQWDETLLSETLCHEDVFFILSNSRALSPSNAYKTTKEIARALKSLQKETYDFKIISRSDSTLRGHIKEELTAFNEVFGPFDGTIVAPFFEEGHRVTLEDTHYIKKGKHFIPVSETEFSKDPVLGYETSHLPSYLEEKTSWWRKEHCVSITIDDIRNLGKEAIADKLLDVKNNKAIIVNSENKNDFKIAIEGIKIAESKGKKFMYRTASSFVQLYADITNELSANIKDTISSCLIVAGSFVDLTTQQLNHLKEHEQFSEIMIESLQVFSNYDAYLNTIVEKIDAFLKNQTKVLVYTERDYKGNGSKQDKIELAEKLSMFVHQMVSKITFQPDLIIAKGGITSHEVLKHGLQVKKANVMGQIHPGIPILRLDASSKFPGSLYVIFPGNVGTDSTLTEIVQKLFKN